MSEWKLGAQLFLGWMELGSSRPISLRTSFIADWRAVQRLWQQWLPSTWFEFLALYIVPWEPEGLTQECPEDFREARWNPKLQEDYSHSWQPQDGLSLSSAGHLQGINPLLLTQWSQFLPCKLEEEQNYFYLPGKIEILLRAWVYGVL